MVRGGRVLVFGLVMKRDRLVIGFNGLRSINAMLIQQRVPIVLNAGPPAVVSIHFIECQMVGFGGAFVLVIVDAPDDADLLRPPSLPEAFRDFDLGPQGEGVLAGARPVAGDELVAVCIFAAALENLFCGFDSEVDVGRVMQR